MAKEFIYTKVQDLGKIGDKTVEIGHYIVDGKVMPDKVYMCKKVRDAEKLRIREFDGVMPLIDVETYENHEYVWYKLESEKDFNILKEAFEYSIDFTVPDCYPILYCVESFDYDNIYEDDNTWTCTINECKDAAVEFWGKFGYKLTFKKVGDINTGVI